MGSGIYRGFRRGSPRIILTTATGGRGGRRMRMGRCVQAGMTLVELVFVVLAVVMMVLASWISLCRAMERSDVARLKTNLREMWGVIELAGGEREPLGLISERPVALGFTSGRSSTEYFRLLMSDNMFGDSFRPDLLGGAGIPCAKSRAEFTAGNNAWCVLCVGTNALPQTPFIISRNVTWRPPACSNCPPALSNELPLRSKCAVWITSGGACFVVRSEHLSALRDSMGTNAFDIMRP